MRIGFLQFAPEFRDKAANRAHVEQKLAGVRADIMVLPELFSTGYYFAARDELAEQAEDPDTGATFIFLQELSRRKGTTLVAGVAERGARGVYNSAVVQTPAGKRMIYRKLHLFDEEKNLFVPGDQEPAVFPAQGMSIGMEICFDYFFPELTRILALAGARIICHPANLILPYAQLLTVARALENRVFWILCNRIGTERRGDRRLAFTGQSQIVAPDGTVLCRAGNNEEAVMVVEIDPSLADNKVVGSNDLFRDRRPEFYRALCRQAGQRD